MKKDALLFALILAVGAVGYYGKLQYDDWQADLEWGRRCVSLPDRVRLPLDDYDKWVINRCVEDGHLLAESDLAWRARPPRTD